MTKDNKKAIYELLNDVYDLDKNALRVSLEGDGAIAKEFDLKTAQVLSTEYQDSTSKSENLIGLFQYVQQYQYPSWTFESANTFSYAHNHIYYNGYLYITTRQFPARLAKVNVNDLTDYTVITFPGIDHTSRYGAAERIIFSEYTNKMYIAFGDADYNKDLLVIEIDPDTLDYRTVIDETGNGIYPGFPTGVAYKNYLYILTSYKAKLIKYDLNDFSRVSMAENFASTTPHAINTDGNNIYVTEIYNGKVFKFSMDLLLEQSATIGEGNWTDEITILGDYIWLGMETELGNVSSKGIYKVNKNDLTDYKQYYIKETGSIWCTYLIGRHIYVLLIDDENGGTYIYKIDPHTNTFYKRKIAIDRLNAISTDGTNIYLTNFNTTTIIAKYPIIDLFKDSYVAGENNNVLYEIDYEEEIVKSIASKTGDIENGNYFEIKKDGTYRTYGNATTWSDMIGDLFGKRLNSTVGKVDYDYDENAINFQAGGLITNQADRVGANLEINHQFRVGESIIFKPHIHWFQEVLSGSVTPFVLTMRYRLQKNGVAKEENWTEVTLTAGVDDVFNFSNEPDGTYNQFSKFPDIIVNCEVSDTIQFQIARTDNEEGNMLVYFMDMHGEVDSDGSDEEYIKNY